MQNLNPEPKTIASNIKENSFFSKKLDTPKCILKSIAYVTWILIIGINLYLYIVKSFSVNCIGGGCNTIIHSSYGSFLGVPVSLYSLLLVLLIPLLKPLFQKLLLGFILLGGVYFVIIQTFVLQSFCIWCNLHHATILLLLLLPPLKKNMSYLSLAIGLPILLFLVSLMASTTKDTPGHPAPKSTQIQPGHRSSKAPKPTKPTPIKKDVQPIQTKAQRNYSYLPLFGEPSDKSYKLVLSMNCPHCIAKFDSLINLSRNSINPPEVYFYTDDQNLEITQMIVAAYLSNPNFEFLWATLAPSRDFLLVSNSNRIKSILESNFPDYVNYLNQATDLLNEHQEYLFTNFYLGTPLLVTPDSEMQQFSPSQVFP